MFFVILHFVTDENDKYLSCAKDVMMVNMSPAMVKMEQDHG